MEPFDDLKKRLEARRVLIVAGTGISMAGNGEPCCTWPGLLRHGLAYARSYGSPAVNLQAVDADIDSGDTDRLIFAAKKIAAALGAPEGGNFIHWLRSSVGALRLQPGRRAAHDALLALDAPIATTNYDSLLEEAARTLRYITWKQYELVHRFLQGDEKAILHLHGYWEDAGSVIFDDRAYAAIVGDATAQALQQLAAGARSLLFVGYGGGLADPNFEQWLAFFRNTQSQTGHRHFRLVRANELDEARRQHARDNIVPIAYGAHYDDLPGFLQALAPAARASGPKPAGITLPAPRSGSRRLRSAGPCLGREQELADLIRAVLDGRHACLLGPGGVGKSTLSLKMLHDPVISDAFGERRYFVYGEAAAGRNELLQIIARDTGVTPGENFEARLWQHLDSGPAVLVLDNLETAWEQDAEGVETLLGELAALPALVLAASLRGRRKPLDVNWGAIVDIQPLDHTTARSVFLQYAGEHLAADPDLDELVAELEGLPLALRLLAAQAAGAPNLSLLKQAWAAQKTALLRTGDTRLTSLAVSAEISIAKLAPPARQLLGRLALLPEGAAEAHLTALLPDNTFEAARDLRQSALAYDAAGRLRLLRPLREHVRQAYPLPEEARRELVVYYCELAKTCGDRIGKPDGAEAVNALAAELGNLEELLPEALEGLALETGITAAIGVAKVYRFAGLGNKDWLEQAAKAAETDAQKAACLAQLGDVAYTRSDNEQARDCFEKAIPLYDKIGDLLGKANCIRSLGDLALRESDNEQARDCFEKAIPLYDKIGDLLGKANCIQSLGDLALRESDNEQARDCFEKAIPLYDKIGDLLGKANCIRSLGDLALRESDNEQARDCFEKAIPLYDKIGSLLGKANCIKSLGDLALRESDNEQARDCFEKAIPLYDKIGSLLGKANCIQSLGDLALRESDNEQARDCFEKAIPLYDKIGSLLGKANCIQSLGDLALRESDNEQARDCFEKAIPLYDKIGSLLGKANCIQSLGDLAFIESDNEQARDCFEKAIPLYDKIGSLLGKANCIKSLGDLAHAAGDKTGALAHWQQALAFYRQIKDRYSQGWVLRRLALAHEGEARAGYLAHAREAWADIPNLHKHLDIE